jgi:acetylornithine deacetylase/succinyl-diaminopimelate desuccinylase-like protein
VNEVTELVQQLIRNRCVNDGASDSGQEARNAELLESYLEGPGIETQRCTSAPGRSSLIARIEGTDPEAPTLCLLGHTDVVPVNEARWDNDPFAGEVIDGWLWGRGAIDMFNLTGSMAVAMKQLSRSGFRPRGTLIFAAVADEEAGGHYGAEHLVEHETDAVRCDYVITESGGFPLDTPGGLKLPALAEERGLMWSRLRVRGAPSHGSMPYGADNALIKAAEIVRRVSDYRPIARIDDTWRTFVEGFGLPADVAAPLLRAEGFDEAIALLPPGMARMAYSCTHTTIAPTMMQAGSKINIIPESVAIDLDIRTLPGDGRDEIEAMLRTAIGDLIDDVDIEIGRDDLATASPIDTPLWDAMARVASGVYEGATLLPMRMVGATDARHFRRGLGAAAYGFGLFSRNMNVELLASMGHGDNERVDLESLDLCLQLWDALARDFLE